ncbi:MAG: hypothetical protein V4539_08790 [Bacteroidota bacterium]
MHQDNYIYLLDRFTQLGFDGTFEKVLKAEMVLNIPEFALSAETNVPEGKLVLDFNLAQSKKETQHPKDYYFLNSVKATLSQEGQPEKVHTFLLYKQQGYHHDKMMNFMAGRSVHEQFRKDGRNVEVWRRIDFNSLDQYKNTIMRPTYKEFDIAKELNKLPFNKADTKEKEIMLKALKNGDKVSVELRQGSNIEKMSLVAMPHLGVINIYDTKGEKVSIANNQLRVIGKEEKPELSQTTKDLVQSQQQQQQQGQQQQQRQGRRAS